MAKYRKKPVVVEAIKYSNVPEINRQVVDWARDSKTPAFMDTEIRNCSPKNPDGFEYPCLRINTLDGTMTVREGDYVVKGTQGEFYPCKPQAFLDVHELVG